MKILGILFFLVFSTYLYAGQMTANDVYKECNQHGFSDCNLLMAIAKHESNFNALKFNPEKSGSYGMFQIQCSTARDVLKYKIKCNDLFNYKLNTKIAIHYLLYVEKTHKIFDIPTWLAAYNAGKPIKCTKKNIGKCVAGEFYNQSYVDAVYKIYKQLKKDRMDTPQNELELAKIIAKIPTNHDQYEYVIADTIKRYIHQEKYELYKNLAHWKDAGLDWIFSRIVEPKIDTHKQLSEKWQYGTEYSLLEYPKSKNKVPMAWEAAAKNIGATITITTNQGDQG